MHTRICPSSPLRTRRISPIPAFNPSSTALGARALAGAALALFLSATGGTIPVPVAHALPGVPEAPAVNQGRYENNDVDKSINADSFTITSGVPDVPEGSDLFKLLYGSPAEGVGRADAAPRAHVRK
jgi:hypothetical protein